MATLDETIKNLDSLIKKIETEASKIFKSEIGGGLGGSDLSALIANRVIDTGKDAHGGTFKPYSKKELYVSVTGNPKSIGTPKGKTGKTKFDNGMSHKTRYFEYGYWQYKGVLGQLEGGDNKNFQLSGDMWKMFGVKNYREVYAGAQMELGGQTSDSQMKIDENSTREGRKIIEPSESEVKKVSEAITQRFIKLIKDA